MEGREGYEKKENKQTCGCIWFSLPFVWLLLCFWTFFLQPAAGVVHNIYIGMFNISYNLRKLIKLNFYTCFAGVRASLRVFFHFPAFRVQKFLHTYAHTHTCWQRKCSIYCAKCYAPFATLGPSLLPKSELEPSSRGS